MIACCRLKAKKMHAEDGEYENNGWEWRVRMSESLLLHVRTFWEGKLARQVGGCLSVCLFVLCLCAVYERH